MRVAVSSIFHEGNSFSRLITGAESFAIVRGEDLLAKAKHSSSSLGGACRVLSRLGVEVVAGVSAVTPPGGPVDDAFYRALRDEIVAGLVATRPDGVYLDLHGAMITTALDDPEGDLIGAIRAAMGEDFRIAVSLDLHAHLTPAMLRQADIIVACKENPHMDYALAGERAAELLVARLRGEIAPLTAAIWLPFIFGAQMETGRGPLAELHRRRREIMTEQQSLLDISIYNCTTLVDVAQGWQGITAIADGDAQVARDAVEELARLFWAQRATFTPDFAPLDAVLVDVAAGGLKTPVILGDQGDRVLAGAAGDGTTIIRALATQWPGLKAVVPVTDPEVVALADSAGIGAEFEASVGGRLSRGIAPFAGRWRVRHLSDGRFIQAGPYLANEPATLGPTAVLESGNLTLLVTSLPGFTQDPEAFRSQGIALDTQQVVVAKSGYHFKISFAEIGRCIVVDTPGISNYRPGLLPFAKRRPVYPEDEMTEPDFVAQMFDRTMVSASG